MMVRGRSSVAEETARRISGSAQKAALICGAIAVALFAHPATATELAILRNGFSIRHEHHTVMGNTTRLFTTADDSNFMDVPTADITGFEKDLSLPVPPASRDSVREASHAAKPGLAKSGPAPDLNQVVNTASANYHLDPDLVNSVIHAESGFNAHAVSPKGARGLMQLMPGTASTLGVHDSFDAADNVEGGSKYLRELLERYNFDLVKALAAYNAGPQRVEQYGGVPPYRETRAYVSKIVRDYNRKKTAQEKEAKQRQLAAKAANAKAANAKAPNKVTTRAAAKPPSTTIAAKVPQ
jgi:hypothetical protein